jgi:hypothetical protein
MCLFGEVRDMLRNPSLYFCWLFPLKSLYKCKGHARPCCELSAIGIRGEFLLSNGLTQTLKVHVIKTDARLKKLSIDVTCAFQMLPHTPSEASTRHTSKLTSISSLGPT